MDRIDTQTVADLFFQIQWFSERVHHTEAYAAADVNIWRDLLPHRLKEALMGKRAGDQVRLHLSSLALNQNVVMHDLRNIRPVQFDGQRIASDRMIPRIGRFYPKGVLKDIPDVYKVNREPFRLVAANNGHLTVDMGHPLSRRPIELSATVGAVWPKLIERGGSLRDWGDIITRGVGMQARWENTPSDFFSDSPYVRENEQPDGQFYNRPRLVQHVDTTADEMLRQIYSRFITDGLRVLDLMSSWQSHLPDDVRLSRSTGLGLNAVEMSQNKQLSDYHVHDLNQTAIMPFEPDSFDVAICSLSVEYLTSPMDIFREVARVLHPGGWFVVTFSNRWFKTKAIRIWSDLHEFERMGLVLEYFMRSERFVDLGTYSIKGLQRPQGDKYAGQVPYADPVYAVWGRSQS